jgi:hypothetical protein
MLATPQSGDRETTVGLLPQRPLIKDVLCYISDTNAPRIRHAKGLCSSPRLHFSARLCTASASLSNVVI